MKQPLLKLKTFYTTYLLLKTLDMPNFFQDLRLGVLLVEVILTNVNTTLDILKNTRLLGANPVLITLPKGHKLSSNHFSLLTTMIGINRRLSGCLLYLNLIRPNIIYAVLVNSLTLHNRINRRLHALRYLKNHPPKVLYFLLTVVLN